MTIDSAATLSQWLETRSYVVGFTATTADSTLLALAKGSSCEHVLRWARHIASFDISTLPAPATTKEQWGPQTVAQEEDDDIDLFGSDEDEDEENEKLKAARVAEYNAKKANKPKVAAKSMVILDVKPWDDETDMEMIKQGVLAIAMPGLVWGTSKLVPIGYGIRKFQITCVIEDDKVGVDDLSDLITALEDYVQSVDVAAFNKL